MDVAARAVRRRGAVAIVAILLMVSACGDDDDGAGDASPAPSDTSSDVSSDGDEPADDGPSDAARAEVPDPCGLLATSDLVDATGLPFADGEFNRDLSNENQSICDWISEDPFATAQVLVTPFGDSFETQRASVEAAFDEPTVDLDLAEAAYRTQEGSLVAMQAGGLFVQVSYLPPGPGDVGDITVGLAGVVLSNLAG